MPAGWSLCKLSIFIILLCMCLPSLCFHVPMFVHLATWVLEPVGCLWQGHAVDQNRPLLPKQSPPPPQDLPSSVQQPRVVLCRRVGGGLTRPDPNASLNCWKGKRLKFVAPSPCATGAGCRSLMVLSSGVGVLCPRAPSRPLIPCQQCVVKRPEPQWHIQAATLSAQISATTKRGCRPWAGSPWGPGNRGADLLLPLPPQQKWGRTESRPGTLPPRHALAPSLQADTW